MRAGGCYFNDLPYPQVAEKHGWAEPLDYTILRQFSVKKGRLTKETPFIFYRQFIISRYCEFYYSNPFMFLRRFTAVLYDI